MSGKAKGSEAPAAGSAEELDDTLCEVWYCDACKSTLDAAYARGLADAAAVCEEPRGAEEPGLRWLREAAGRVRALAGTDAQPPPDARVKELLEALRDELIAVLGEAQRVLGGEPWDLRFGLFARIDAARRSLLGASDPSPSEGAAPHATERGEG